jgi:nicotinamidase-related amidase
MSATALLVIDVQESFRHRPHFDPHAQARFIDRLQALVDGAEVRGIPVVQVFHVEDHGPFSLESGFVTTLSPLRIAPDAVFHKRRHSALVGSGLDVWLTTRGISRLIISGIRTEQCCETTARHASDLGWQVDFVSEATFTSDIADATGKLVPAADIKSRTELVLADRFARIATVEQALTDALQARAA